MTALLDIPGIDIGRSLHESFRSVVYQATRVADHATVVVKCLRGEYPSAKDLARFRNDFEVTRSIASTHVLRPERFGMSGSRAYLVLPYFEGQPASRLVGESLPLEELLGLALGIVRALGEIHEAGVVHKDLSPGNILVDPGLSAIRVIDFEVASPVGCQEHEAAAPSALEGTLRYMAPEQTGRMNRAVDFRADFYSLGVVLYELLVGAPLFEADDAAELVHQHIAKRPFFPLKVRQRVPHPVRDIILKLLAKTPEDRYQSTAGIASDLELCLAEWKRTGTVEPFTLGEHDASDRFVVAQRLYGRDAETGKLLDAFARAATGEKGVVLIAGASGIGKSALVRELHKPILERRGYFAAGKADQLRRTLPYAALSQALRELARQLLQEDATARARWRQQIEAEVGPLAGLLAEIVPELEALAGPFAPTSELEPAQAQARLRDAFRALVRVLGTAQHPLVLAIDDLQWIDSAALGLLRAVLLDPNINHLLFVGSLRDNEVGPAHPVTLLIAELGARGVPAESLALAPLREADVVALVAETLPFRAADVKPLARLVHQRTGGNPFFVGEYLQSLHRERLITFQRSRGVWGWDEGAIRECPVSDDLVELVREKLLYMPPATRAALQVGACVGLRFDLGMLAALTGESRAHLARDLLAATRAGIVTLTAPSYRLAEVGEVDDGAPVTYRFVHDRVRQEAYELLEPGARRGVHRRIAALLTGPDGTVADEHRFEVVDHLNQAFTLLDPDEQRAALMLNLEAARRAKLNAAYDVALRCLRHATSQLPPDAWTRDYALTRDLTFERAECEYLGGRRELVEEIIADGLRHVSTPEERARFYTIAIPLRTNQGRPAEAIQLGAEALAMFGVELPPCPSDAVVRTAVAAMRERLEGLTREELLALPRMTDPEKLAIMRLLNRLGPPAYFTDAGTYALMHCLVVSLSLEHGHASESVRGYSVYGMILVSHEARYAEGRRYGELAIDLADRLGSVHMRGVSRVLFGCFIAHWTRGAEESLAMLDEAYRYLREAGDLVLASFGLCFHTTTLFAQGQSLDRVELAAAESASYLRDVVYRDMAALMECLRRVTRALAGGTARPTSLAGPEYDEGEAVAAMRGYSIKTPIHFYYVAKMQLCYLFGEYDEAARLGAASAALLPLSWGALYTAEHLFYGGLTALALGGSAPGLPDVGEARARLLRWAEAAPDNFRCKHLLFEAECARREAAHDRALGLYEDAIEAARQRQNLPMEALAAELAGKYHLAQGRRLIAGAYLKHAHYSYIRWGATAKAGELGERHASLLGTGRGKHEVAGQTAGTAPLANLDLAAFTKATVALSEEIVLEKLVAKFMRILVENAGAESGALVFARPNGLRVLVRTRVDDPDGPQLVDEPLAGSPDLIPAVVEAVAASKADVIYEDAASAPGVFDDEVVRARAPRSVLSFAVMHLGRLSCIVYLENNLAAGAFTAEHVEVLRLLSAQAAISMENANLYAGLEEKLAELERAQRHAGEREDKDRDGQRLAAALVPRLLSAPGLELAAGSSAGGRASVDVVATHAHTWIALARAGGPAFEAGLALVRVQGALGALVRAAPGGEPAAHLAALAEVVRDAHPAPELLLVRCAVDGRVSFAGAHTLVVCRARDRRCASFAGTPGSILLEPGDLMVLAAGVKDGARLEAELLRVCDHAADGIRQHLARVLARGGDDDRLTLLVARRTPLPH